MNKNIIYEDDHIIVVQKPAGIATQTARTGQQDMVSELKNYLAGKPGEPGKERKKKEPYLGVVHVWTSRFPVFWYLLKQKRQQQI